MVATVTWDAVNKGTAVVLSNNNLTATIPGNLSTVRASEGRTSGKWYWEINFVNLSNAMVGIVRETSNLNAITYSTGGNAYYYVNGNKYPNNTAYGQPYTLNDTLSVLLDMDLGTIEFWKNGVSQGVAYNNLKDVNSPVYPAITSGAGNAGSTSTVRFNIREFTYQPPEGYLAYDGSKSVTNKVLLLQNEKSYSMEAINTNYETKMTSNTAPTPYVASAESSHSDGTFPPWKAFNGTNVGTQDVWISANGRLKSWIQIDYGKKMKINRLNLRSSNYVNYSASSPKNFDILYSDDGINFKTALTVKDQVNWGLSETREFTFKEVEGRFFRIDVKEANNNTYITIGEVLFGYKLLILNQVPSNTEQNLINYGMNSPVQFDGIMSNKNYILQDTVSENAEGLWTTQINRKPLSIKFN